MYASDSRALATLEILVGLRTPGAMRSFVLINVSIASGLVTRLDLRKLPDNWNASPPTSDTRAIGDQWLARGASVALRVPSAIVPNEFNYLLNPHHPDFTRLVIGQPEDFPLDPRLLRAT